MLVKGSKVSRRSVWSKEIGHVGRLKVLKCFEDQRGNFEMNTLMNRTPMKFFKRGSNMVVTPNKDQQQGPGNFALIEAGQGIQREDHSTVNYSSQVLKKPKSLQG